MQLQTRWWLAGLVVLGSSSICGCEGDMVGPGGTPYVVMFDDAGGLTAGGRVFAAGVRIGRIQGVTLADGKARVELTVEGDAVVVHSDACASVGWYGAGSAAHLALDPGKAGGALEPGATISCTRAPGPDFAAAERALEAATKILEEAATGKGVIALLLRDEAFAAKVVAFFDAPPPATAPPETSASAVPEVPTAAPRVPPTPAPAKGAPSASHPKSGDPLAFP